MASVMIEFDCEREPTLKEAILLKRIAMECDWEALIDLTILRATKPVARTDLEALTLSQAKEIGSQLGVAIGTAMALAGMEKATVNPQ